MNRQIATSTKCISILILTVMFMIMIAGCGRTNYYPMESSEGMETETDVSIDDVEKTDIPMSTDEAIKARKLKQFKQNNANTSIMKDGSIKNILVVGQDRREWDKAEMRSDSMMIFSINTVTNQINLVSLMRDMYLPCADGKDGIINLTYLNGGADLLARTIEMNFGIHIDNYIETDFWRFMDLYDFLGGVEINLTAEEAPYLNDMTKNSFVPHYDHGDGKPVWSLQYGMNQMNPEQLLCYCRARQNLGGDWARTERQRNTIIATYNKLNSMSYAGLIRLIKGGAHYLTTDMSVEDMLGYFYWLKKNDITQINSYRLPLEGTYTQEIREVELNVLVPQIEANKNAIQQYIYGS